MLKKIQVGKLFREDVYNYEESVKLDIKDAGIDIKIIMETHSDDEIHYIQEGNFKIGFLISNSVILFLF